MVRLWHATIGLSVLILPALPGCTPTAPSAHPSGYQSLTGSVWALRSLQSRDIPRFRREAVTLRLLPDHGIAGTASCNSVGGREFTWTATTDSVGSLARDPSQPTITTVVGCNDVVTMQIANQFWTLMTKAREWSIDRGDLLISFDDGTMAVLKSLGPAAPTSSDCHSADPNNLDCVGVVNQRDAKR